MESTPPLTAGPPKVSKDLQVKESQLIKHIPFTDMAGMSSGKLLSNQIQDEDAKLRTTICAPCLAAVASYSKQQTVGRGSSLYNEVCSCLVSRAYGRQGTQCARCVGLGKGGECADVPAHLMEEAKALVKLVPKYNKVLLAHKTLRFRELLEAEQAHIEKVIAAATRFNNLWLAHKRGPASMETPSKRRKLADLSAATPALADVSQTAKDARSDIQRVHLMLTTMNKHLLKVELDAAEMKETMKELKIENETTHRLLRQNRARQRHLLRLLHARGGEAQEGGEAQPEGGEAARFELEDIDLDTDVDEDDD